MTLPLLRTLTSQTEIEARHLSVYDADLLDLKIKGQRVIWFTSVKPFGAEQLRNRFVFVNPDEGPKQDAAVLKLQRQDKDEENPDNTAEFRKAQAMTKKILEDTRMVSVKIPYLENIEWPYQDKRWLFPIFKNILKTITKIHYAQREKTTTEITATEEDFEETKKLWGKFQEHIIYRVSKPAKKLLDLLPSDKSNAKTKADLTEKINYSTKHIGRLLDELGESELVNAEKIEHSRSWRY